MIQTFEVQPMNGVLNAAGEQFWHIIIHKSHDEFMIIPLFSRTTPTEESFCMYILSMTVGVCSLDDWRKTMYESFDEYNTLYANEYIENMDIRRAFTLFFGSDYITELKKRYDY